MNPEQIALCNQFSAAWAACESTSAAYQGNRTVANWQAHVDACNVCADLRQRALDAGIPLGSLRAGEGE